MLVKKRSKFFVIGRNKTGTTSVKKAFKDLGYIVGDQRIAESLFDDYCNDDFSSIIKYCRTAQVFQDIPFSLPETYKVVDKVFPGSKFILTIRDDSEQWYNSITKFHGKKFGLNGALPSVKELKEAGYVSKDFIYKSVILHGTSDLEPYEKKIMCDHYDRYNKEVIEYFKGREECLLVINLSELGAYGKFIDFLGIESEYEDFPWENKT